MIRRLMKHLKVAVLLIFLAGTLWPAVSPAAEEVFTIRIKDHRFSPEELKIPAGKKVKIIVRNEDATPEEFESYELRREKVVSGRAEITLYLGPLKAGRYRYFGDFHPDTAKGVIVAGPTERKGQ